MPLRAASFSTCRNTSSGCVAADCADDLAAPSGAGTDQSCNFRYFNPCGRRDVSLKNFGIGDARLAEDIRKETNIIVHMAATVNFAERYDTALAINTMGVKHMIDFASKCTNLELVLLVSTAYVNLMKQGIMMEKPLQQWRSYDGRSDLDISEEMAFKDEKLKELVYNNASERTIRHTMKKIGAQRAKKFGWANAYVFTKAMGEMLAYEQNSRLPIVIIRPSATTSTWKEPFPGWIEGAKAIDTWITNYGKGTLKFFPTDVATVIDIVPADIVVNAMLCIISYHPQGTADFIYQIGSSMSNPIKLGQMSQTTYKYFSQIPFVGAKGDVVKVKQPNFLATMASFYETMDKHYKMPLQDMLRRGLSTTEDRHIYNHLKREYDFTVAVAEVYWPFTISKTRFDDSKMQNLMGMVTERDRELIPCNIKFINWDKYFMETHIPGDQQQLLGKQSHGDGVQIWSSKALPWLCLGAMEVELAGPAAAYRRGKTMEVGMGSPGFHTDVPPSAASTPAMGEEAGCCEREGNGEFVTEGEHGRGAKLWHAWEGDCGRG
uniref:Fatty acyl-CoA reductase n=1 Tax=Oryza nivara TaxID=4536 RepID=A0A0E0HAC4_ORYNI